MSALILVVEDEPAIQTLLEVNLRRAGYRVAQASDAATARKLVDAELPDLILLDWMLPGMSGVDFARRLRSDGAYPLAAHHHADRPSRRAGQAGRPGAWRRRLRHQALQSRGS